MSLVAEVLASIKQRRGVEGCSLGGDGVCVEIADLAKRAGEAKVAVIQALEGRYVDLCSVLQDTTLMQARVAHNLDELQQLKCSLDTDVQASLSESVDAVSGVAGRWKQAVEGLEVAQQLLSVHRSLNQASQDAAAGKFYTAATHLNEVEKLIDTIDPSIEILPGLIEEIVVQRSDLVYTLSQVWTQAFRWEEETHQEEQKKTITLIVRCLHSEGGNDNTASNYNTCADQGNDNSSRIASLSRDFHQVLAALSMLDELAMRFAALSNKLLRNFFQVLVTRNSTVRAQVRGGSLTLSVTFPTTTPGREGVKHPRPIPAQVFLNFEQVMNCLHQSVFGLVFETDGQARSDDTTTGSTTLMRLLGEEVGAEVARLLITECLSVAVPCSRKHLDEFDEVKKATEQLHAVMVDVGFILAEDQALLHYSADVDAVFSAKACAHILDTARELIKQPLHHTVTIAPSNQYPPLVVQDLLHEDESGVQLEKSTLRLEKLLSAKTFQLPPCQVSRSVVSLVELLYTTLEEACGSSAQYAGRLVGTVRDVLTLYTHVAPVAHASTLLTIPQHAALMHNNSMYITTHCYLMGHQYKNRLPAELRDGGPCTVTFTDLSYEISQTGAEVFCKAMQRHRKTLVDTIGQAQGFGEVPSDDGVRACLRVLQELQTVWHDVLPNSVYIKAMGTFLNSVCREIIERTVSLEDITEASAASLAATLAYLCDTAPALLPNPSPDPSATSASRRSGLYGVREWGRLQELRVVLIASLRELQDRWAAGKGPLALYFTPEQTKTLIRALFQNTERRAQLLAKIT